MAELDKNDILIILGNYIHQKSGIFGSSFRLIYEDADKKCKLPAGSTKQHLVEAVKLIGWYIEIAGTDFAEVRPKYDPGYDV